MYYYLLCVGVFYDSITSGAGWGGGGGPAASDTEYIFLLEMKKGLCVCPLSWSGHCNFTGDSKCNERGWACTPPPSPAWANFTLMIECTPESSRCYSVYSVSLPIEAARPHVDSSAGF